MSGYRAQPRSLLVLVPTAAVTMLVDVRQRWGAQFPLQHHCIAALDALVVILDGLQRPETSMLVPNDRLLVAGLHVEVGLLDSGVSSRCLQGMLQQRAACSSYPFDIRGLDHDRGRL